MRPSKLYYTQSISKSLAESRVVKSKERTQPYVTETEARRLTNQEFERRRVYSPFKLLVLRIHFQSRTAMHALLTSPL